METKKLHFETLQLHVGQDNPTRQLMPAPYLSIRHTSYVFRNSAHAAARFGFCQDPGNITGG